MLELVCNFNRKIYYAGKLGLYLFIIYIYINIDK